VCDLGCGHAEFIPNKNAKDKPAEYATCNSCGSQILVEESRLSPNTCPVCGKHCPDCKYDACPSTYSLKYEKWS
jgi:DNA-directed RNA polymerase subunit RPC12/RpoP